MLKKILCTLLMCLLALTGLVACGGDDVTTTPVTTTTTPTGGDDPTTPGSVTGKATSITFSLFSDLHYKAGMYMSTIADMNAILDRAKEANADFILSTGDFCNDFKGSPELTDAFLNNSYDIPALNVYGNHELESSGNSMQVVTPLLTSETNTVIWGTEDRSIGDGSIGYYFYEVNGFRIICLDTNYSYNPTTKVWEHNKTGSYGYPSGNQNGNALGPVQEAWLKTVLMEAADRNIPCVIFSHASFSGKWESGYNHAAIRAMFKEANQKTPGTVLACFNGHLHTDHTAMVDGVFYMDVNTVRNGYWTGNGTNHYTDGQTYKYEVYDAFGDLLETKDVNIATLSQAKNTYFFEDPLSCIVTISADGKITVNGQDTDWIYDIDPNTSLDGCVTKISSGEFQATGKTNTDITGTTAPNPGTSGGNNGGGSTAIPGTGEFTGSGTKADPFQIKNAEDLMKLSTLAQSENFENVYFKLTADIDLADKAWTPLKDFAGAFDGDGHIISNLTVNVELVPHEDASPHGGFADNFTGKMENIAFLNLVYNGTCNVTSKQTDGGFLFGGCFGSLTNVFVDGTANLTNSAKTRFGTIAGYVNGSGGSYNNVVVVSNIQGQNDGIFRFAGTNGTMSIYNCYHIFKEGSSSGQGWVNAAAFNDSSKFYCTGSSKDQKIYNTSITYGQAAVDGFFDNIEGTVTVADLYGDSMQLGEAWTTYDDSAPLQDVFASHPQAQALRDLLK